MKNRILIITAVFPPEPVVSAKLSKDLADTLSVNHKVTVISPRPSRPLGFAFTKNETSLDFQHIITDSFVYPKSSLFGRFKESYSFGRYCYNHISKHSSEYDIIYVNSWPLLSQYFIIKVSKKFNIPVVMHIQDIYPESLTNKLRIGRSICNWLILHLDKYILKRSNKVIAISDSMKLHLSETRHVTKDKIVVIPNWQNEEAFINFDASNKEISDAFTFMYMGNIGPVAGVELLIESFERLQSKKCRLIIAGSGSMKDTLEKKVSALKLANVSFITVPYGMVPKIQAQADILLLPVKQGAASSSIPSKLPAYMFSSKPIIACVDSDSDTAHAIINAGCGWVVHPESITDLLNIMNETVVLSNETLLDKGKKGFQYAKKHFSKKENLSKIVKLIEETVK